MFAPKCRVITALFNHQCIVVVRKKYYKTHGLQCDISLRFQNALSLTDSEKMCSKCLGIRVHEAIHHTDLEEHTARTVAGRTHLPCTAPLNHPLTRNYVLHSLCLITKVQRQNYCGFLGLHRFGNQLKTAGENHGRYLARMRK